METADGRSLLVVSINVILNDALVQGQEGGLQIAYDITDPDDGQADTVRLPYGQIEVFNPGDDADHPDAAYLKFTPSGHFRGSRRFTYQVDDIAPNRVVNGMVLDEPEPTHRPRTAQARVRLVEK